MPTYSNNYDRSQFGGQGGYWGTGVELQPEIDKTMKRLLSPVEWEQQDQFVRRAFGSYMNYINAFTMRQKAKKSADKGYLEAKGGTFQQLVPGGSFGGMSTSTRGHIPVAGKGGAAIPRTTIHRDISGRPTQEIAGGGVQRGMGGQVIPQTAEQYGEIADIERGVQFAVPRAQEKTAQELIRQAETGMKLEDISFKGSMTAAQRYKESIRGQKQQQIEAKAVRDTSKNNRWLQTMDHKEHMANVRAELRRGSMLFADDLRSVATADRQNWQKSMAILKGQVPGTEQSKQRHQDAVDQAIRIADNAFANAKTKMEMDAIQKQTVALNNYREWLDKQIIDPGIYQNARALATRVKQFGQPQYNQPSPTSAKEVKRSIDGRIAIFNADTKKFIRWE